MDIRVSADDGNKSTVLVVLGLASYNRWQIDFAVFIGGITMDVREKLVELIEKASYECGEGTRDLWDMREVADGIADFLIANGVTVQDNTEITDELLKQLRNAPLTVLHEEPTIEAVQQWISVKDRSPEEDGKYLVYKGWGRHYWCEVLSFAKDGRKVDKYDFHRGWKNVWYGYDSEYGYVTTDSVTHWMPLPQPPKGD